MKSDVVVIGAGMAGLAAGALLAKRGYRTLVLEKGNQPGGRAYTTTEKGFTFNYGAHAMYAGHSGVLAAVMRELGKPLPPGNYPRPERAFFADGERYGAVGTKPHHVLTSKLFGPAAKVALGPLMLAVRTARIDRIPVEMAWSEWVEARTRNPELRRFANALGVVNTYSRPAGDISARFLVGHLKRNMFKRDYVVYVSGGWSTIYGAFNDALREHGGDLVTGSRVETLETEGGRISAAVAGGVRYEAAAFVCTLPPQDVPQMAAAASPLAAELASFARLQDVRAACIDLGFSRRVRDDGTTFIFDVERDLYYSLHSEVTPDLAPEGKQLLHAMAYLSPEEAASDALAHERKRELEAGLDRFFPGWRDAVEVERPLPNVRVTGLRRTPEQVARAMPLRSATVSNLYFAGDSRDLPYNLTEGVLAAAVQAADAIAELKPAARAEQAEMVSAAR